MEKETLEKLFSNNSDEQALALKAINETPTEKVEEKVALRLKELYRIGGGPVRFYAKRSLTHLNIGFEEGTAVGVISAGAGGGGGKAATSDKVVVFKTLNFAQHEEILPFFDNPQIENWDLTFFSSVFDSQNLAYCDPLVGYLKKTKNPIHTSFIVKNLGRYKKVEHIPVIQGFLTHADPRVVANAVEGLQFIGDKKIIPIVTQLCTHGNNRVQANAVRALSQFDISLVKQILTKMVATNKPQWLDSALFVVKELKNPELFAQLLPLLENKERHPQWVELIDSLDPKKAVESLNKLLALISEDQSPTRDFIFFHADRLENKILEGQVRHEKEEKRQKFLDSQKKLDVDLVMEQSEFQSATPGIFLGLTFFSFFSAGGVLFYASQKVGGMTGGDKVGIVLMGLMGIFFFIKGMIEAKK